MMEFNDNPCGGCEHYDPVLRGKKNTKWAWCAKKSVYAHHPGPGQVFPGGVQQVEEVGQLARPYIVSIDRVVSNCQTYKKAQPKKSKRELIKDLQMRGGKVVQT